MSLRHLRAPALCLVLLLTAACSSDEEPAPEEATPSAEASPEESQEAPEEPGVPLGEDDGDVSMTVDGEEVPGDEWAATCAARDGGFSFNATATPLSTVQVEVGPDGTVGSFVASGEDYGPFTAEDSAAEDLRLEITGTGFAVSGSIDAGTVEGELTCPG